MINNKNKLVWKEIVMILVVCVGNFFLLFFFLQYPQSFFILIYFELKANKYVEFLDKLNGMLFPYIQKTEKWIFKIIFKILIVPTVIIKINRQHIIL